MSKILAVLSLFLGIIILICGWLRVMEGLTREPGGWSILGIYAVVGITSVIVGMIGLHISLQHHR